MSFPGMVLIHSFIIFTVPLCLIFEIVFLLSRTEKMKKTKFINVSNKRDDAKFEYIKPTIESTSNWVIADPLSCMDTLNDDKKTQTKME